MRATAYAMPERLPRVARMGREEGQDPQDDTVSAVWALGDLGSEKDRPMTEHCPYDGDRLDGCSCPTCGRVFRPRVDPWDAWLEPQEGDDAEGAPF